MSAIANGPPRGTKGTVECNPLVDSGIFKNANKILRDLWRLNQHAYFPIDCEIGRIGG